MTPGELRYLLGDGQYKRSSVKVRARCLAVLATHEDWVLITSQECVCSCGSVRHYAVHLPTGAGFLVTVLRNGDTMVEPCAVEVA